MEADIRAAGGELVGIYYETTMGGEAKTPAGVSAEMDAFGWAGGWRASDADGTLWNAGGGFLIPAYPWEFIVETSTMRMVAITSLGGELDILGALSEI